MNNSNERMLTKTTHQQVSENLELPAEPSTSRKFTKPPFEVEANDVLPPESLPTDRQGRKLIRYCKEGVHLFSRYYALWDGYYTLYAQKVYPIVHVDDRWYIFQKERNPITKKWEGGIATHLTPTVF